MNGQWHWEAVPNNTRRTLELLAPLPFLPDFYLAGGTALALQIGHRISKDLDFFSASNTLDGPARSVLAEQLRGRNSVIRRESDSMVYATVEGVEVSFVYQHHALVEPTVRWQTVAMAGLTDIGLRYFVDAENDPRELVMLKPVRWQNVKKYCEAGARLLTQRHVGLSPKGL